MGDYHGRPRLLATDVSQWQRLPAGGAAGGVGDGATAAAGVPGVLIQLLVATTELSATRAGAYYLLFVTSILAVLQLADADPPRL